MAVPYTYAIDLSQSWTTSDVEPLAVTNPPDLIPIKQPLLWYNAHEDLVHMWAGLPFAPETYSPGSYVFTPNEMGNVSWTSASTPASSNGTLEGLWASAWSASSSAVYSVGGHTTFDNSNLPVTGMLTNDFNTSVWTNTTSAGAYDDRFSLNAQMLHVPNFGDDGLLVALGGTRTAVQSIDAAYQTLVGMSSINVYDVSSQQWYTQGATGTVPPAVTSFGAVGVESQDGGSFEM